MTTQEPVNPAAALELIAKELREAGELVKRQLELLEAAHANQELRRRVERERTLAEEESP